MDKTPLVRRQTTSRRSRPRTSCCGEVYPRTRTPSFLHEAHIDDGYRVFYSVRECLASAFAWHNESINVWTHGFACAVFASWFVSFLMQLQDLQTEGMEAKSRPTLIRDVFVILMFTAFGSVCFFSSTVYHLFLCHSKFVRILLYRIDQFVRIVVCNNFVACSLLIRW
jgi:predicted membrane channel-forming protein YqfA (hemolysin III family)